MSKTDIKVRELVNKVERGELTLPEMQRRYVWPATRVRDLLDSLYRGYPSGTILVWESDQDIQTRDLAVRATREAINSQRLLLLDGQQRITSLSAIITGEPIHVRHRKRPIEILFNLEHPEGPPLEVTEIDEDDHTSDLEDDDEDENKDLDIQEELKKRTFVVASKSLKNDPIWVPVADIFLKDHADILEKTGVTSLQDPRYKKYAARLKKVKDIENYSYVMEVLEKNMSYQEVTDIFVRVNSLGIKLRGSDLALAQITSRWKGFMNLVEKLAEEFKEDGEYVIQTGLVIRMLVVIATGQCQFKTVGKISKKKLEESWITTVDSIRFAINFVKSNAGIERLSFISSPFLLIPIALFSALKKEHVTNVEQKTLLRWFYVAHMRGHYGMGSSEGILDQDIKVIFESNNKLHDLFVQLKLHVKKIEVDSEDVSYRSRRSPFFSMLYFVLRHKEAKDWYTGLKLSDKHAGARHRIQFHHIFPKSLLRGNFDKKIINEISNLAFIAGKTNRHISNKEPSEYFTQDVLPQGGVEALSSQLIPLDKELWKLERCYDFIVQRRILIAEEINAFMKQFE